MDMMLIYFLILFNISSAVMMIVDAIIAYYVPVKRIEKRLKNPETINELATSYGKGVYSAVKPQLKKDLDSIITRLENKVNSSITTVINNDIPHIMDEKLEQVETKLSNQLTVQLNDLQNAVYRNLGSQGGIAKGEKQQERLLKEQLIRDTDPKAYESVVMARMLKKFTGMSNTEMDMLLDMKLFQLQKEGKLGSKGSGTVSILPGSLPHFDEGIETVRQAPCKGTVEKQTGAQDQVYIAQLRQQMTDANIPKELQDKWINEGKQKKANEECKQDGEKEAKK